MVAVNRYLVGAHVLGAVDVRGLAARFDTLPPTNNNARSLWAQHGLALAQRVTTDAQTALNAAIVPAGEFGLHDAVVAFGKRATALSDKVLALPPDDNPCPIWSELKSYFVDGGNLANQLEGVASGALKWSDVKEGARAAASGIASAAHSAASTAKWTSGLLIGGTVLLGAGVLYTLYKVIASDTGKAVATTATRAYLGGRGG